MINYIIQICSANMFMGQTEDCQVEEISSNTATSTSGKDCGRNQMLLNKHFFSRMYLDCKIKAAQASQELYPLQSPQGIDIDFLSHMYVSRGYMKIQYGQNIKFKICGIQDSISDKHPNPNLLGTLFFNVSSAEQESKWQSSKQCNNTCETDQGK